MRSILHVAALVIALCAAGPDARAQAPRQPGDYPLTADSLARPGIAHGILEGPFEFRSQVFAGTARRYWVYVPAGYDPARPPNLLVFQDGQRATNPSGSLRVVTTLRGLLSAMQTHGVRITSAPEISMRVSPGTTRSAGSVAGCPFTSTRPVRISSYACDRDA